MFKTFLVGILLLNYFLVVVVTNITTVNAVKYTHAYSAKKPYVHAPDCQQRFYLQIDCFEKCHHPAEVNAFAELPLGDYLSLLAHGLDFHQLTPAPIAEEHLFYQVYLFSPISQLAVIPGFIAVPCPPPNFG